jgi:hypothetical protein
VSLLLKYSYFHCTTQIDREGANAEKVMQELANFGVISEAWGGDVPMVQVRVSLNIFKQTLSVLQPCKSSTNCLGV